MKKLTDRLNHIRTISSDIVLNTPLISIDENAIGKVAKRLSYKIASDDNINQIALSENLSTSEKIALSVLFSSIHYCFVDPTSCSDYSYFDNDIKYERSKAFWRTLIIQKKFKWDNLEDVLHMSKQDWRDILHLDDSGTTLWDSENRYIRLLSFAEYLQERKVSFDNFFTTYSTAQKVYTLLYESGLFNDDFLKRLQVEIVWLDEIAQHDGLQFDGRINELTAMADYRLPQLLMQLGVIEFADGNLEKLNSQLTDKKLERTIRAATIYSCQKIANVNNVSEARVDRLLWNMSQEKINDGEMKIPAMRVATHCY